MTGREGTREDDDDREGGDAACWAHLVCPACGHIREGEPGPVCESCGASWSDDG